MFIAVPNAARIEFNELHGALLDMPPNHVGRWNPDCFAAIARRHDWQLADHQLENEPFAARLKEFALFRFLRAQQRVGTLPNMVGKLRPRLLRLAVGGSLAAGYAVASLQTLADLAKPHLGNSQWVHFRRGYL
jgi:hypothetical protein